MKLTGILLLMETPEGEQTFVLHSAERQYVIVPPDKCPYEVTLQIDGIAQRSGLTPLGAVCDMTDDIEKDREGDS